MEEIVNSFVIHMYMMFGNSYSAYGQNEIMIYCTTSCEPEDAYGVNV